MGTPGDPMGALLSTLAWDLTVTSVSTTKTSFLRLISLPGRLAQDMKFHKPQEVTILPIPPKTITCLQELEFAVPVDLKEQMLPHVVDDTPQLLKKLLSRLDSSQML